MSLEVAVVSNAVSEQPIHNALQKQVTDANLLSAVSGSPEATTGPDTKCTACSQPKNEESNPASAKHDCIAKDPKNAKFIESNDVLQRIIKRFKTCFGPCG